MLPGIKSNLNLQSGENHVLDASKVLDSNHMRVSRFKLIEEINDEMEIESIPDDENGIDKLEELVELVFCSDSET